MQAAQDIPFGGVPGEPFGRARLAPVADLRKAQAIGVALRGERGVARLALLEQPRQRRDERAGGGGESAAEEHPRALAAALGEPGFDQDAGMP